MQIDSRDKTFFRAIVFPIYFTAAIDVQQCKVFHKKQMIVVESNSNL